MGFARRTCIPTAPAARDRPPRPWRLGEPNNLQSRGGRRRQTAHYRPDGIPRRQGTAGERFTLEGGPHVWVMRAEPGQSDVGKTVALIVAVAVVAGLIIAVQLAESVDDSLDFN